jgi:hypothetical protein
MPRKIISLVFLLITAAVNAFAHTATVENGGENRYKAIRLTPEIYNNANVTLSDLRITDGSHEEVPYFINSGNRAERQADRQTYPMTLIHSYTKDDDFYFDYRVREIPDRDIAATSLEVTTQSAGFAKNIAVYGSYDNVNWEFAQNGSFYRVDGASKLNITFDKIQKYTHYRLRLGNNLERISFDTVTLARDEVTRENIYFIESITPAFRVEEQDRTTVVYVGGLRNLRLAELTLDTDSMFQRNVTSPGGNKELYHLSLNGEAYTDTTIAYHGQPAPDSDFALTIHNGDDKPIHVKGITVKYYADELVFEDRGSDGYTLFFSKDSNARPPVYDVAGYKNEILKGGIDRLDIKTVALDQAESEPEQYDYRMLFNVVTIAVAVLLGLLIVLKLRKKP